MNVQEQPQWLTDHKAEMLAHLLHLSRLQGWEEYAADKIKRLESDPSKLYRGITKRIEQELTAQS